jgi:hypothetical protein
VFLRRLRRASADAGRALRRAEAGGENVDRWLRDVQAVQKNLGRIADDIGERELEARIAKCESLGRRARQSRELDQPERRSSRESVALAPGLGEEAGPGHLTAGAAVILLDAAWDGGCRLRVKSQDGTAGWADESSFSN